MNLLADSQSSVRESAANNLGELKANAKPAVPALARALKDQDPGVAIAAGFALGHIGSEAQLAIPQLLESVSDFREVESQVSCFGPTSVSYGAAIALKGIGPAVAQPVGQLLEFEINRIWKCLFRPDADALSCELFQS